MHLRADQQRRGGGEESEAAEVGSDRRLLRTCGDGRPAGEVDVVEDERRLCPKKEGAREEDEEDEDEDEDEDDAARGPRTTS